MVFPYPFSPSCGWERTDFLRWTLLFKKYSIRILGNRFNSHAYIWWTSIFFRCRFVYIWVEFLTTLIEVIPAQLVGYKKILLRILIIFIW